jgi:hypothetical protein
MLASRSRWASVWRQACEPVVKLGKSRTVFTVVSSGYCIAHLLLTHHFSTYVFLGALAFATMATVAIAWITDRVRSSR